jgi:modulator of FtsH protease
MEYAWRENEFYPDNHSKADYIVRPGPATFNQFVAQTWRFFFYGLFLAVAGVSLAFFFPIPLFTPVLAVTLELIPLIGFITYHYIYEDYDKAFYAFLLFAGILGLVLGPQLALIAATIQNGMFLITMALSATVGMTFMLHNYAWFSSLLSLRDVSLFGAFVSTIFTGFMIIGIMCLIFPTPLGIMLYSAVGVAVFSLYLVYDVYLLKIGAFKSPIEAAMNLFLDVVNLFLETLRLFLVVNDSKNSNFGKEIGEFFMKRVLPILFIVAIVVSLGFLEKYIMSDHNNANNNNQPGDKGNKRLGYEPGHNNHDKTTTAQFSPRASAGVGSKYTIQQPKTKIPALTSVTPTAPPLDNQQNNTFQPPAYAPTVTQATGNEGQDRPPPFNPAYNGY